MDAIASVLGSLFVLVYLFGGIALVVYLVLLLRRHVLAQERIANAMATIAQHAGESAVTSTTYPDVGSSA